jgi:hypothetical protein
MVNLGLALYLWWRMRIVRRNGKDEFVGRSRPISCVGFDGDVKTGQIVGIWKGNGSNLTTVEFPNICTNE